MNPQNHLLYSAFYIQQRIYNQRFHHFATIDLSVWFFRHLIIYYVDFKKIQILSHLRFVIKNKCLSNIFQLQWKFFFSPDYFRTDNFLYGSSR